MNVVDKLRKAAIGWDEGTGFVLKDLAKLFDVPLTHSGSVSHSFLMKTIANAIEQELEEKYVALPKDADGVPIHVGDDMVTHNKAFEGEYGEVECLYLTAEGWEVDGWDKPETMNHYHPDTWERIIEDALAFAELPTDMDKQLLVDRCRALAGDVE